jgi:predicted methyltransferase
MKKTVMKKIVLASVIALVLSACDKPADTTATAPAPAPAPVAPAAPAPVVDATAAFSARLDEALAGSHRSDANKARDAARHPKETLTFFGMKGGMTVVELAPGGGWYTEVLAPALRDNGKLIVAVGQPASGSSDNAKAYMERGNTALREKFAADAAHYDQVLITEFDVKNPSFGAPGSADMVVTFRNVHNWTQAKTDAAMFKAAFDVLKPGGVLGVTDHRAAPGTDSATSAETGYITEAYVEQLATDAGFQLAGKSEINANPLDTKDHPEGVWTLPPSFALKDKDREKYAAIGESDRMTLRFVKPGADATSADAAASARAPLGEGESEDSFEPVENGDAATEPKQ